jgi:hypothetical protein
VAVKSANSNLKPRKLPAMDSAKVLRTQALRVVPCSSGTLHASVASESPRLSRCESSSTSCSSEGFPAHHWHSKPLPGPSHMIQDVVFSGKMPLAAPLPMRPPPGQQALPSSRTTSNLQSEEARNGHLAGTDSAQPETSGTASAIQPPSLTQRDSRTPGTLFSRVGDTATSETKYVH